MNSARGEVALEVAGIRRPLCLTLGALAELETTFACSSIEDLQARFRRLSATEISDVLQILLRAAGQSCSVDGVSPRDGAKAIAEAFHAALA